MFTQLLLLVLAVLCSLSQADKNFSRKAESYIINGKEADISDVPFLAYIKLPRKHCGGSLISEEWVVTAGHCVNLSLPPKAHRVRLGTNRKDKGGVIRWGLHIVQHEGYHVDTNEGVLKNDIALIKIRHVKFSDTISPATLPEQNEEFCTESMAEISGFGTTRDDDKNGSKLLMTAAVPYLDTEHCKTLMWDRTNFLVIPEMQVCFGDLNGGSNVCKGDFGGPLVVDCVLVGISSWVVPHECEEPETIGVYVRMSYYRDWITKISGV